MGLVYSFKFNSALAAMSIPPSTFSGDVRADMQLLGQRHGLTPQEAAIALVAKSMGLNAPAYFEVALMVWTKEGKVNLEKPAMIEALRGTIYG